MSLLQSHCYDATPNGSSLSSLNSLPDKWRAEKEDHNGRRGVQKTHVPKVARQLVEIYKPDQRSSNYLTHGEQSLFGLFHVSHIRSITRRQVSLNAVVGSCGGYGSRILRLC